MKKELFISIILPAFNEETNIRLGALDKVAQYLRRQNYSWEVLIVDDGSTDATASLCENFIRLNPQFSLIKNPHRGKAATVVSGFRKAKGGIVLFSDLDQATPLNELENVLPWIDKGYDIVIGSRSSRREGAPFFRLLMARTFMIIRTMVLGLRGISDTQCGFKAFKRECALNIINRLSLYAESKIVSGAMVTAGFDLELLFVAKTLGYKIREIPVEWHYVETRRVNPIKDGMQGLSDIIKIRMRSLKGAYTAAKEQ